MLLVWGCVFFPGFPQLMLIVKQLSHAPYRREGRGRGSVGQTGSTNHPHLAGLGVMELVSTHKTSQEEPKILPC